MESVNFYIKRKKSKYDDDMLEAEIYIESLRKEFLDNEWPAVRRRIKLLGLSPDELFE